MSMLRGMILLIRLPTYYHFANEPKQPVHAQAW